MAFKKLDLGGNHLGDVGLKHLKGFSKLQTLLLWRNQLTGVGLKYFMGLSGLRKAGPQQQPTE